MKGKKIIVWSRDIDSLIFGENFFGGGITVQMYFWAKTFAENGWQVSTFSKNNTFRKKNINFFKFPSTKYANLIFEILFSIFYIIKIRPDIIFIRGASRNTSYLSIFAKLIKKKLVFLSANDLNFIIGKENIHGMNYNTKLYRWGIKNIQYFVVQNQFQREKLYKIYCKKSILIPNIWNNGNEEFIENRDKKIILWVSNFRKQKRPHWFINLAKTILLENFTMVGAPSDYNLFLKIKSAAEKVPNLNFVGGVSFEKVNELFLNAKLLICTSEYEGFPNTFLQAWANCVPVISTVDPSNVIKKYNLGISVHSEYDLSIATRKLLTTTDFYSEVQNNIQKYFSQNHDSDTQYKNVIKYLKL